jgi:hypothetical protein
MVQSQPRQIIREALSQKSLHKNRGGRVAQGEGPEFKNQCQKNFFLKINIYIYIGSSSMVGVRDKNIIFNLSFYVLGWGPRSKRQISKRKRNRSL